jgi:hypothetical protein
MYAAIALGLSAVLALAIYGAVYIFAGGLALLAVLLLVSGTATILAHILAGPRRPGLGA